MTLTTDKYFNTRFRLGYSQTLSSYTLTVGGALNFVKNGADTVGYHAFDMIASDSNTGTLFDLDIGGLNSSGKAVYMTTAKNGTVGINFNNNSSGVFAGGSRFRAAPQKIKFLSYPNDESYPDSPFLLAHADILIKRVGQVYIFV